MATNFEMPCMASARFPIRLWLSALLVVWANSGENLKEVPALTHTQRLSAGNVNEFIGGGRCSGPVVVFFSGWDAAEEESKALAAFEASSEEVTGLACMGWLDCGLWRRVCDDMNIRATPSVVIYPTGAKAVRFYRGPLTQEGFTAAVARVISFDDRTLAVTQQNHVAFLADRLRPIKVLLFSRRAKSPVIFKALSGDPELWPHIQFGFVQEAETALLKQYKIENVPRLLIQFSSDAATARHYTSSNMSFPVLRHWLLDQLRDTPLGAVQAAEPEPEVVEEEEEEEETAASAGKVMEVGYEKMKQGTRACPAGAEIASVQ
ncbi:unnamed protein product, partial [Polarella glacialis]